MRMQASSDWHRWIRPVIEVVPDPLERHAFAMCGGVAVTEILYLKAHVTVKRGLGLDPELL